MKFNIENLQDIFKLTKELAIGLKRLNLLDNFTGGEIEIQIDASSEKKVRNSLTFVPTRYIIVDQTGNGLITRGTTPWSSNFLYFQNHGANSVTAKIFLMR